MIDSGGTAKLLSYVLILLIVVTFVSMRGAKLQLHLFHPIGAGNTRLGLIYMLIVKLNL